MSEAGASWYRDEERRRWVLRPPRLWGVPPEPPEPHLPRPGMEVAGYRLEERLGSGGQGTVFRARREGRLFAVKFIFLPSTAHWAWRELDVMVKLWDAGGLPLEGHGLWPAREPLFLFLVTPLVRGRPADAWAREHNPHALEVAGFARWAARQLAVVHEAGVIHRDVKGANLLVRDEDGRPVLVDFGVATYAGAPKVTGPLPPGTWAYLSPRVWRAWRGEEQSTACPGDDLWALGVELYWLLTGRLPFQGREGALVQAILHEEPRAPHEENPRVPRALGEVCQRLLRKQPGEGYADAWAVEAALEEVMKQADEAWKVPLLPETRGAHHAPEPPRRSRWALGAAGVVLVLGLGLWLAPRPPPRTAVSGIAPVGTPRAALAPEFFPITLEPGGQEVAPPWKRPEGDGGAAPEAAPTSAPVARATPSSKDTRVKTSTKGPALQPPPQPPPQEASGPASTVGAALLSCALATGCTPGPTTTSQVRSTPEVRASLPPPAPCPEGAARTMKELGILHPGSSGVVEFPGAEESEERFTTVRPGPLTMRLVGEAWGPLPFGTLFTGELLFGERVQGRFTQATTPDGHTYPVCLELRHGPVWGLEKDPGETPTTARIQSSAALEPVEHFGETWRYEDREER